MTAYHQYLHCIIVSGTRLGSDTFCRAITLLGLFIAGNLVKIASTVKGAFALGRIMARLIHFHRIIPDFPSVLRRTRIYSRTRPFFIWY